MDDAGDLRAVERAAGMQRQQHRGARLLLLAKEAVLVRQREVHARRLHRGERADRARQLALEAALEGEPLLELGLAEAGAVHQLEARDRALRQAGGRHLQAQVVNLCRRNEDRRAAFGHAVGHVHLRQLGDDGAAVLVGQVGVEHLVVAVRVPRRHREDDAGERGDADQRAELAAQRHRLDAAGEGRGGGQRGVGREGDGVVHGSFACSPAAKGRRSAAIIRNAPWPECAKQAGIAAPVRANGDAPRSLRCRHRSKPAMNVTLKPFDFAQAVARAGLGTDGVPLAKGGGAVAERRLPEGARPGARRRQQVAERRDARCSAR